MSKGAKAVAAVVLVAIVLTVAAYFTVGAGQGETAFGNLNRYVVVQGETPEIVLVDMYDDTIAGKLTLPSRPDQIAVSNEISRILYSNREARTISVYDIGQQDVEATIELPFVPDRMVLSPDGLNLAVADEAAGKVGIVKLDDYTLFATLDGFERPANFAFSNDSDHVMVSDSAAAEVKVIGTYSGARLDPIALTLDRPANTSVQPDALNAVTRTPNGLFGLVTDRVTNRMSIINFRNWQEAMTIRVGANPTRPYGTADGRYMMVANNDDSTVTILSTEYFDVEATLPGVPDVTSIVTGYFETLAYVVSGSENKALIIDLNEMKVAGEIELGGKPGPAIVEAGGLKMYVPLTDTNELAVIDVREKALVKKIRNITDAPHAVATALVNNYCH